MLRDARTSRRTVIVAGSAVALAGCSTGGKSTGGKAPSTTAQASSAPAPAAPGVSAPPPVTAQITAPATGSADLPTAVQVALTVANASKTEVVFLDAAGGKIPGVAGPGGAWRPATQLQYATAYQAQVTATGADGTTATASTSFTTMKKPGNLAKVTTVVNEGQTVGVAMPFIINFGVDVAKDQRAAVQQRLSVVSEPAQEGAWNWFTPQEVHFRPKEYWQPGTRLTLRASLGGLPIGGKWYAEKDLNVNITVGRRFLMEVENRTHQLTVTQDGTVLRTIPVSNGRPGHPSASGSMMIMIKNEWEWFDSSSFGVPSDSKDGYRLRVYWPQRLTWDGEYLHSAPWSVGDQGKRNVSHGCTNLSPANAEWLWHQTLIGDPVIIRNTDEHVQWGNGWTDWDVSWDEYVKGSAIPYQPPPA